MSGKTSRLPYFSRTPVILMPLPMHTLGTFVPCVTEALTDGGPSWGQVLASHVVAVSLSGSVCACVY